MARRRYGSKRTRGRSTGRGLRRYRYKRRRLARRSRGALTSARGLAFPTQWKRTLNYVDRIQLNPGTGGLTNTHVYRANGIYDPDFTATGHQPMGYDEIMQGYEKWTVIGSKITATFNPGGGTFTQPCIVGIELSDTSGTTAGVGTIIERGRAKYKTVAANGMGGPAVVTVTNGFSAKKFFGLSQLKGEDNYQGSVGSDPTRQAYYMLFGADTGTDDPGTIEVLVKIEYYVIFQQPRKLLQSV